MFGLDLLSASSLLILAASGSNSICKLPKPTVIDVDVRTEKVKYDVSRSMVALQQIETDTIDPYAQHGKQSFTQGFMEGGINMTHQVTLGSLTYPLKKQGCIWYDEIHVELSIDPKIYIAKEVYADKCMRRAVIHHELKHVNVDRTVVNIYAKRIAHNIKRALRKKGFLSGPFPEPHIKIMSARMQHAVHEIVDIEFKKMERDRFQRQQRVDSLEEYERVSGKCPNFTLPRSLMKALRALPKKNN